LTVVSFVATDVSGTNQVMILGETGLGIPPGGVQRLKEAMIQLLSDPARAKAMAAAARQRVEESFSAKKQPREHIALFSRARRRQN